MSFLAGISHKVAGFADPLSRLGGGKADLGYDILKPPNAPPPPPAPPNPNDARNAAQEQSDQMRKRRGLLSNIFAGASSSQPVTGKQTLGT